MTDLVLLLLPTTSYKAEDFLDAARRLGVEVVIGTDGSQAFESVVGQTINVGRDPDRALERIRQLADTRPVQAVVGTDDETTLLAARAAHALGLPHNPFDAVEVTRDKYRLRQALAGAGLSTPWFEQVEIDTPPETLADRLDYPCVIKPLSLSGSRGVMRADDPPSFVAAFRRVAVLLTTLGHPQLMIEGYLPGVEVAVDGLLDAGQLHPLVLFDKPDPLVGPTFEETIYVTPSRLADEVQQEILDEVARGCRALGLCEGPVHAELRVDGSRVTLLEVAPRTIGGLCSRTLRFGTGVSLEQLVLRHALRQPTDQSNEIDGKATGVMMIPTPAAGRLRGVDGLDRARALPGVQEVTITLHQGAELVPLPEGHRYLGFIFAVGDDPAGVEATLRQAHEMLEIGIEK